MDSLEKIFGKTAQMTVLKNLIERPNEPTYLAGIAEETGLSHASVSRVITPLIESGVVQEKPLGKQIRTFKLRNDETIISSISVTDIVFDVYLKKWNYKAIPKAVSYTHLRAHETDSYLVCRLLLEKK